MAAVGFFTPSVAALAAGLWFISGLHTGRLPDAGVGRVLGWYLEGICLFAASLPLSYARILPGENLDRSALFSVGNWAISGSAVGLVLANYDLCRTHALQTAGSTASGRRRSPSDSRSSTGCSATTSERSSA